MSGNRKNERARWTLPVTVDPSAHKCVSINVPDDPFHIAAFNGALLALASAYNWKNDSAHTAVQAANVWRDIIDGLSWGCDTMPQVQFMSSGCELSASFDGGVSWQSIFNAYDCARAAAQDEINSQRNDGQIGSGGQQPAKGNGVEGQCYTYNVELRGNDKWKIPLLLEADDTITVSECDGGWADGSTGGLSWWCPDGHPYFGGACFGVIGYDSADPAPTIAHMRLVGVFESASVDLFNLQYTIPSGGDGYGFIQANDSDLSNNLGSVRFKVVICKHPPVTVNITLQALDGCIINSVTPITNHRVEVVMSNPVVLGNGWTQYSFQSLDAQPFGFVQHPTFGGYSGRYNFDMFVSTFGSVSGNSDPGIDNIAVDPYIYCLANHAVHVYPNGSSSTMTFQLNY